MYLYVSDSHLICAVLQGPDPSYKLSMASLYRLGLSSLHLTRFHIVQEHLHSLLSDELFSTLHRIPLATLSLVYRLFQW